MKLSVLRSFIDQMLVKTLYFVQAGNTCNAKYNIHLKMYSIVPSLLFLCTMYFMLFCIVLQYNSTVLYIVYYRMYTFRYASLQYALYIMNHHFCPCVLSAFLFRNTALYHFGAHFCRYLLSYFVVCGYVVLCIMPVMLILYVFTLYIYPMYTRLYQYNVVKMHATHSWHCFYF